MIEILSATLKKKIEIETGHNNKENDDEDITNVRETMQSFLVDSKYLVIFSWKQDLSKQIFFNSK